MYHASVFDVYDTKENHLLYEYFDRMTAGAKTSKSSFIDGDPIPTYGHKPDHGISMSGCRVKRGLYKSADGTEINADVNGSLNIGRKYDPWMFDGLKDRHVYAETTRSIGYRDFHPEAKGK